MSSSSEEDADLRESEYDDYRDKYYIGLKDKKFKQMHTLFRIGREEPPTVPNDLSRDARDFILHCLHVDPNVRPAASQLLDPPFVKRSLSTSSGSASPYQFGRRI